MMELTMSDDAGDDLLAQIAGGDMRALELLYREMRVPVFAVALAVVGDRGTAEDVLQDTFVRVYAAAPEYRPESRARAWVQAHASECYRGCDRPLGVPALSDQLAAVAVTMGEHLGIEDARCSTHPAEYEWLMARSAVLAAGRS